jgi:hypothetical protein
MIRTLFLIYKSIISISTYPHRQLFQLYISSRLIGLRGKTSKQGLDKICKNRELYLQVSQAYRPAFLLRDPWQKGEAWKDLQMVMRELGMKAPKANT